MQADAEAQKLIKDLLTLSFRHIPTPQQDKTITMSCRHCLASATKKYEPTPAGKVYTFIKHNDLCPVDKALEYTKTIKQIKEANA